VVVEIKMVMETGDGYNDDNIAAAVTPERE
jgi:hypothetical protein